MMSWVRSFWLIVLLTTCSVHKADYIPSQISRADLSDPSRGVLFVTQPARGQIASAGEQLLAGAEGYYYQPTGTVATGPIKFIIWPSTKALREFACRVDIPDCDIVQAFSFTPPGSSTCYIHIADPAAEYVPGRIGHEFTHCLYGAFHRGQDDESRIQRNTNALAGLAEGDRKNVK